jgi:hypothetical protein
VRGQKLQRTAETTDGPRDLRKLGRRQAAIVCNFNRRVRIGLQDGSLDPRPFILMLPVNKGPVPFFLMVMVEPQWWMGKPALAQEFVERCAREPVGLRGGLYAIGANVDV